MDLISSNDFDIIKLKEYFNHNNLKLRKRIININQNVSDEYDIFINSTFLSNLISKAKKASYFLLSFPQKKISDEVLKSYIFIPNSQYTLNWAKKYWKKKFDYNLSYPKFKINNNKYSQNLKKNIILSVGRWTPLGHSKKQFEMAKAFYELCKNQKFKEWKLILAGSLDKKNNIELDYFNKTKDFLKSKRVSFELYHNLPRNELLELYRISKVYWHFTGYNENLEKNPELAEHFGISIVEAIINECIPYVFSIGGSMEIIKHLKLDNSFFTVNELIDKMCHHNLNKKIKLNKNFLIKFTN